MALDKIVFLNHTFQGRGEFKIHKLYGISEEWVEEWVEQVRKQQTGVTWFLVGTVYKSAMYLKKSYR